MSDRSDRIKELAESYSDKLWAIVIGLPPPFTAIVTLTLALLSTLGAIWLWRLL